MFSRERFVDICTWPAAPSGSKIQLYNAATSSPTHYIVVALRVGRSESLSARLSYIVMAKHCNTLAPEMSCVLSCQASASPCDPQGSLCGTHGGSRAKRTYCDIRLSHTRLLPGTSACVGPQRQGPATIAQAPRPVSRWNRLEQLADKIPVDRELRVLPP